MCLICVDFQKAKMNLREAQDAFREMKSSLSAQHAEDVKRMLEEAEKKEKEQAKNHPRS